MSCSKWECHATRHLSCHHDMMPVRFHNTHAPCLTFNIETCLKLWSAEAETLQHKRQNIVAIKYLNIYHAKKWCIRKRCISMRTFTSRSPVRDTINIYRSAAETVRKTRLLRTIFTTLRWILIALQIGERELNQRIIVHLFWIQFASFYKHAPGPAPICL